MERELYILTGCTGVGKTEWALKWAGAHDAEIISCDSLLFYRGMDIGTAKPTRSERQSIRHHLVDVCDLTDRMDIAQYVKLARSAAEDIHQRGKTILVCGGSGFYLASFFRAVTDAVAIPAPIKERVAGLGVAAALQLLRTLNPTVTHSFDWDNPRRVARALERGLATGKTIDQLAHEFAAVPSPFSDWKISLAQLTRDPVELAQRIDERVRRMLVDGLIAEVEQLRPAGLEQNATALRAIGYREVLQFLDGKLAREKLPEEIAKNTRALVKKQRTWFRAQLPSHRQVSAREIQGVDEIFTG